jgi:GGDEF domain-containing protein
MSSLHALNPLVLEWEGSSYTVGASLGLVMSSTQIPDESAWLKAADAACYAAKHEGRGRLRIAAMTVEGELHFRQG